MMPNQYTQPVGTQYNMGTPFAPLNPHSPAAFMPQKSDLELGMEFHSMARQYDGPLQGFGEKVVITNENAPVMIANIQQAIYFYTLSINHYNVVYQRETGSIKASVRQTLQELIKRKTLLEQVLASIPQPPPPSAAPPSRPTSVQPAMPSAPPSPTLPDLLHHSGPMTSSMNHSGSVTSSMNLSGSGPALYPMLSPSAGTPSPPSSMTFTPATGTFPNTAPMTSPAMAFPMAQPVATAFPLMGTVTPIIGSSPSALTKTINSSFWNERNSTIQLTATVDTTTVQSDQHVTINYQLVNNTRAIKVSTFKIQVKRIETRVDMDSKGQRHTHRKDEKLGKWKGFGDFSRSQITNDTTPGGGGITEGKIVYKIPSKLRPSEASIGGGFAREYQLLVQAKISHHKNTILAFDLTVKT